MSATFIPAEALTDHLAAGLSDAAFEAAARHGVRGSSVELELELWGAVGEAVRGRAPWQKCEGLAGAVEAAYGVALRHGFDGPFTDLELDLWSELRRAGRATAC
jgi:hypothetical protein